MIKREESALADEYFTLPEKKGFPAETGRDAVRFPRRHIWGVWGRRLFRAKRARCRPADPLAPSGANELIEESLSLEPPRESVPWSARLQQVVFDKAEPVFRLFYVLEHFFSPSDNWPTNVGWRIKGMERFRIRRRSPCWHFFDLPLPKYCLLLLLAFIIAIIYAHKTYAASLEEVTANIQKQYETIKDLQADFTQSAFNRTIRKKQTSSGMLYMKKPGLMRWDYEEPEKQIIVLDEEHLWWYTPKTKQVIKQVAEQAIDSNLAVTFMGGLGKLRDDFKTEFAPGGSEGGHFQLKLVPRKPQVNFTHILLTVDKEKYNVKGIDLHDFYGNVTTILFSGLKINSGLDSGLFEFTPPPGIQIITPRDFPGPR